MIEPKLSRRENQIMELLYEHGDLTVSEVTERMPDALSRNAIRTFLTILHGKEMVQRIKRGREYIYSPIARKPEAASLALGKLLDVFFDGSISNAVAARFDGNPESISEEEFAQLEKLVAEAKRAKRKRP